MLRFCILLCTVALSMTSRAAADAIYVQPADAVISGFVGQRGEARFKVDNINWDLGLGSAVGTTGSFINSNLGNAAAIIPKQWSFEITNDPTAGLKFRVKDSAVSQPWVELNWGTTPLGGFTSIDRPYNTIRINARATGASNRSLALTNLLFSVRGSGFYDDTAGLLDRTTTPTTSVPRLSNFPSDSLGSASYWLVTDGDFSKLGWSLTGQIKFNGNNNPNPGENLRFFTSFIQYNFSQLPANPTPAEVPEPAVSALVAVGLSGMVLLSRGRR